MSDKSKLLLVFDLNCLLGYRQNIKILQSQLKGVGLESNYKPHIVKDNYGTFYRPNSEVLLNTLFVKKRQNFDIAVWANQTREETDIQVEQYFKSLKFQLKFILYTSNRKLNYDSQSDTNFDFDAYQKSYNDKSLDLKPEELLIPKSIPRDLNLIFKKYSQYNEKNTIIISNFHNENEKYTSNDIVIPMYHPFSQASFNRDAHLYFLNEYLHFAYSLYASNSVVDIREGIKQLDYQKMQRMRTGSQNPDSILHRGSIDDIRF